MERGWGRGRRELSKLNQEPADLDAEVRLGPASPSLRVLKESGRERPREVWEGAGHVPEPVNDTRVNEHLSNLPRGLGTL